MAEHQVMSQVDEHHSHQRDFVSHMRSKAFYERGCQEKILLPIRQPVFFLTGEPRDIGSN